MNDTYAKGQRLMLETKDGITVPVTVIEERRSYGREERLVAPDGGKGAIWVTLARLKPRM